MADNSTTLLFIDPAYYSWCIRLFYGWCFGIGMLGFFGNGWLSIGILKSKQLRSRFYVMILFLLVTRVTISFQYVVCTSFYMLCMFRVVSEYQSRILCQILHLFVYFSSFTEELMILVLSLEATVATALPLFYRRLTSGQAAATCFVVQMLSVGSRLLPPLFIGDLTEIVLCITTYAGLPSFFIFEYQQLALALSLLSLLVFVMLIISAIWRIRQAKRRRLDDERHIALRRQLALLPLLRNMLGSHLLLLFSSRAILSVSEYYPTVRTLLTILSVMLQLADLATNVVIMLITKKELRQACLPKRFTKRNVFVLSNHKRTGGSGAMDSQAERPISMQHLSTKRTGTK